MPAPACVDDATPRLSWQIGSAKDDGLNQSAFQILVATSPDRLEPGKADLWDSGRVNSPQTSTAYAGKPLPSSAWVYWKVRTWAGESASEWTRTPPLPHRTHRLTTQATLHLVPRHLAVSQGSQKTPPAARPLLPRHFRSRKRKSPAPSPTPPRSASTNSTSTASASATRISPPAGPTTASAPTTTLMTSLRF